MNLPPYRTTVFTDDWAAIVAELSWAGRTPDRHERALRFHGEELEETGDADG